MKLINSIKTPPHESCTVQAKVELSSADTVYFNPDASIELEKAVLISPSLLHIDNYTTYLEMYNLNDYTTTLLMNTLLGQVTHTPYQVQSFTVFDAPGDLSLLSSSRNTTINNITLQPTSLSTTQTINKLTDHIAHPQAKQQLCSILQRHAKVFDTSDVTQTNTPIQHTINTGDALPISSRPYLRTIQQRRELQDQIQKMVQTKQIRPSNSPWLSPVILHKKKDGTIRFLVDYQKLNSVTNKDSFPQPTTEELLHRLGGHRFYTKLDLKSGYFEIPIHETDKEKTAFVTQDGLWEFNALP